jgi:hypothetical protein
MEDPRLYAAGVVLISIAWALRFVYGRARRRVVGPAAVGVFYDLMSHDRRNATEIIVEQKAEQRDSERAVDPKRPR